MIAFVAAEEGLKDKMTTTGELTVRPWSAFVPGDAAALLTEVLESKWLNTGPRERQLRDEFRQRFGARYVVACNNGTAALRASYAAIGVGPGDEVVTTPYTFIATNTAILEQGATPVFADIQYETLNVDPASVDSMITPKTKAIVGVHYGGNPVDLDELRAIASDRRLPFVEDAAHALGAQYKGKYIGATGDFVTFSFQAVKIVTSGDGGMIATSSEAWHAKLRQLVWYGVDRELRPSDPLDPLPDDITLLGFKYNMNDLTAALALSGLRSFEVAYARRRAIGECYRREFSALQRVRIMDYRSDRTPNYQIFPVHVDDRAAFAAHMRSRRILIVLNNRRNDRYSIFGGQIRDLPNTERADADTVLIPLHAELDDAAVDQIVDAVQKYDRG